MTDNILTYLIINNLILIHFVGLEDVDIKDHVTLIKKYVSILIIALIIHSMLFYVYKMFLKKNLLFLMPIFYVSVIYTLTLFFKVLDNILIIYNKNLKSLNDIVLSNSSLIAITFFAFDKSNRFLEGISILVLSTLGILIVLMIIIPIKKNFEKNISVKLLENEPLFFFIMFVFSLIPNIIILIHNSEKLK